MKKFTRLSIFLHEINRIGSENGFRSQFYSSNAMPSHRFVRQREAPTTELYRRISPVKDQKISIVPILDQWGEEGSSVDRKTLRSVLMKLSHFKRYHHALEVSMWMTEKRRYNLTSSEVAIRLHLILKVKGIEQAEQYFNNVPQKLKGFDVYGSLLKCYAAAECVEKAEAVMQKMRDLRFAMKSKDYNIILILYNKTGKMEKFDGLLKEMEQNGVAPDKFTFGIQLTAYAAVMNVEGMDEVVKMLESDPKVFPDWTSYAVAASGYGKARLSDKAFEMLKKAETLLSNKRDFSVYNVLTLYANLGRKDEVLRVWSLYDYKKRMVENKGYSHFLKSLVILDDIELAEKIFNEWESRYDLTYDMNIPNILIDAYSRKGLIEKAEAFIDRAISKGGKPNAWTWYHLVEGFFQNEQPQKAVEMMKKAILMLSGTEWEPVPEAARLKACLEYLKGVGDTEQTEEFGKLIKPWLE